MKTTIEELKMAKKFVVEQWYGVTYNCKNPEGRTIRSGGYKKDEYEFIYNPSDKCLYISGNVFGKTQYRVVNSLEVLFRVAQEYGTITVKLEELSFDIHNIVLRID